jgi:hypothetical protein
MSLYNLILFPYIPQELYLEYKSIKNSNVKEIDSLSKCLKELFIAAKSGDKLAQLILFDFHLSINHNTVFKDNITGKRLEQRLSKLFALSTGDEIKKENPNIETLLSASEIEMFDTSVLNLICSNYRNKGDLFFFNSKFNSIYKLSIKSLVPTNKEINFGAFEFQSTIKGIDGLQDLLNLQERNRKIDLIINGQVHKGIGLGSSKQMYKIIEFIKFKNKLEEYLFRFRTLLKGVYKDDFLIYIKDNHKFCIYLVENADFIDLVLEKVAQGFKNMRIEGNAMRITDLEKFKTIAKTKLEYKLVEVIPNYNEIETLVLQSDHNKLSIFRNFIHI